METGKRTIVNLYVIDTNSLHNLQTTLKRIKDVFIQMERMQMM